MNTYLHRPSRRHFIKKSLIAGAILPLAYNEVFSSPRVSAADRLNIHIFSKHLQFLNYRDMSEAAAEMGFNGIDLTIRPEGHVLPEKVESDLPKAVEAMRKVGFAPLLMVSNVNNPEDPLDKRVLKMAAGMGFKYYRMRYFSYPDGQASSDAIRAIGKQMTSLSALNRELSIVGLYQNHSGLMAGASIWELQQMLENADKSFIGAQYDIRHATVEGGLSWPNGLHLIHSSIKSIALKDFKWEQKDGVWGVKDTPIGMGMVDFKKYFKFLKTHQINVPVSLHLEYEGLGGAQHGNNTITIDKKEVFAAMKRDLAKVQELWQQA